MKAELQQRWKRNFFLKKCFKNPKLSSPDRRYLLYPVLFQLDTVFTCETIGNLRRKKKKKKH